MNKEKKITPELRFPEFENDGEWVKKPLIDTADKNIKWSFTGGPFGSNLKASDYTAKGIRIIQLQNIGDGEFNDESKIYTSVEKADELLSCNIYAGDIILSKMGDPVGRACIIPNELERCVMASDGIRLVVDENKYSKYFIYLLINSRPIRKAIQRKSTGSTRKRIGLNDLREVQLTLPEKLKEQQKIAACVSSLDELIAAHDEKLDALKEHKKGLLQNLFPQKGRKVPKYRFPEFEKDREWVEISLGEHIEITSGFAFKSKFFADQGKKLVTPKNFTKEGRANFTKENTKYTSEKYKLKYLCHPGDLLILLTDLTPSCELLGKPILLKNEDEEVLLNQRIIKLETTSNLNKVFLFQFFLTNDFHRRVKSTASGTTVRHSSNKIILETNLLIPKNTEEQEKIASCLSNLDKLIEIQTRKIEQLRDHKKGLMQGFFSKI